MIFLMIMYQNKGSPVHKLPSKKRTILLYLFKLLEKDIRFQDQYAIQEIVISIKRQKCSRKMNIFFAKSGNSESR